MRFARAALHLLSLLWLNSARAQAPCPTGMCEPEPRRRALVIGISDYQHPPLGRKLQYADRDAGAFAEFLTSPRGAGLAREDVMLLVNREAVEDTIMSRLQWLVDNSRANDVAIIYFAGHADVEQTAEPRLDDTYLLASDALPEGNYAVGGAIWIQVLNHRVDVLARKKVRVLLITDACRAGVLIGGDVGQETAVRALAASGRNEELVTRLLSSGPRQESREGPAWGGGHGVFTHFLLEGLRGRAADRTGAVRVDTLFEYVRAQVISATGGRERGQRPMMSGNEMLTVVRLASSPVAGGPPIPEPARPVGNRPAERNTAAGNTLEDSTRVTGLLRDLGRGSDKGTVPPPTGRREVTPGSRNAAAQGNPTENRAFNAAIAARRLFDESGNGAWEIYTRTASRGGTPQSRQMKTTLTLALADQSDALIARFVRGGPDQPNGATIRAAAAHLDYRLRLIDAGDPLRRSTQSRRFFLGAWALLQDDSTSAFRRALRMLDSAAALQPQAAYTHAAAGMIHARMRNAGAARQAFDRAIARAPKWSVPVSLREALGRGT